MPEENDSDMERSNQSDMLFSCFKLWLGEEVQTNVCRKNLHTYHLLARILRKNLSKLLLLPLWVEGKLGSREGLALSLKDGRSAFLKKGKQWCHHFNPRKYWTRWEFGCSSGTGNRDLGGRCQLEEAVPGFTWKEEGLRWVVALVGRTPISSDYNVQERNLDEEWEA